MNKIKKKRKVKPRIKVAPPSSSHKSVKDYDRKKEKKTGDCQHEGITLLECNCDLWR